MVKKPAVLHGVLHGDPLVLGKTRGSSKLDMGNAPRIPDKTLTSQIATGHIPSPPALGEFPHGTSQRYIVFPIWYVAEGKGLVTTRSRTQNDRLPQLAMTDGSMWE